MSKDIEEGQNEVGKFCPRYVFLTIERDCKFALSFLVVSVRKQTSSPSSKFKVGAYTASTSSVVL